MSANATYVVFVSIPVTFVENIVKKCRIFGKESERSRETMMKKRVLALMMAGMIVVGGAMPVFAEAETETETEA